ncbi:uncharacterized protein N7459_009953 [Penicillium hispanicum]|uniref:uncharacterized protein n=1 Tax=Penicillium hispanicum TaxID=1080232 RepID=UPI00253FA8F2|nr:uncharacterized protein N7459_009953 [Penicillium hispanicum]KAJ5570523.1 hypothetical protein N7459_009953 [Penicillium hispanicum]
MAKPVPRTLQARINHLIQHWPSDAVRPAHVSVPAYLQACLGQKPDDGSEKPQSTPASQSPKISDASVNALSALLQDRFVKAYPMRRNIRYPASDPEHYDMVIQEFAEAPNRDWFGRIRKRLGGLLRLS